LAELTERFELAALAEFIEPFARASDSFFALTVLFD
jgi:hypothetical protein